MVGPGRVLVQIIWGVSGGVAVSAVRFAVALMIVGEGVLASNQFMVGPVYFRFRFRSVWEMNSETLILRGPEIMNNWNAPFGLPL